MIGGFVAGTLVGALETLLLALFTGEWWGCLEALGYAVAVYGVLCAALGALCGAGWGFWIAWRRREPSPWSTYALVIAIAPLILVATNRVVQDLFQEGISLDSASYLWVLVLLVIVLDVVFLSLFIVLRRASASRYAKVLARSSGGLALGLVMLLVALSVSHVLIPLLAQQNTSAPATTVPQSLTDHPNVIIILADALRADRLGCYRADDGSTPAIDKLAHDGVVYQCMTAQASWTKPSVATLLTSMYPSSHRAVYNESLLPDAVTTLPEVLSAAGYHTVAFSSNPYVSPNFNFQQGFDEFYLMEGERFGGPRMASRLTFYVYAIRALKFAALDHFLPIPLWPQYVYQEISGLNECVIRWLEVNRRGRFFMYIHYMDPHDPYFAHPYNGYTLFAGQGYLNRDLTPEMERLYEGEATYLDTHVGRLLSALKTWGIYDETLIIFTSDHGEEFDEHGGFSHGQTLYQEQVAVPLIIKYPGEAYRGQVDGALVQSLDIAPTVLDVAGLPVPTAMQGLSLRPGADGDQTISYIFSEVDRWGCDVRAIRDQRHKLIIANEDNPRGLPTVALFDLQTDPGEQNNLTEKEPDTVRRLRAQLDRALAFAKANAVASQSGELDPATQERLRQLGY